MTWVNSMIGSKADVHSVNNMISVRFVLGAIFTSFLFLNEYSCRKIRVGPCYFVLEDSQDCPDPDFIKLYLFTRKNKNEGQYVEFTGGSENITSSHFNPQHPNKIIIHGYGADVYIDVLQNIKKEYLREEEMNVWMVNYPKLVEGSLCYPFAVHNIQYVGHCLAQLVTTLRKHAGSSTSVHAVGFSLGAHVTNYMANKLGKQKLDRITGLDPAGPLFSSRSTQHRLDASDANFVDVVHTNALVQGIVDRSGHVDFYMNGGVSQPGCQDESNPLHCDHHRAPIYFAETIRSNVEFLGWKCDNYMEYLRGECKPKLQMLPMGDKCPVRSRGFYIAYTASEEPFALGNWTEESYQRRAPKTSFTKLPRNVTETEMESMENALSRIK